tara:strand:- start:1230 stop:1763 length:534 start_codon:yes stop_codon:yes gene_type:complete
MNCKLEVFNKNNFTLFLDRDDTIIVDYPYQSGLDKIKLIEPAIKVLSKLNSVCNYFLVTNQSGINRKKFTKSEMDVFNKRLLDILKKYKIHILDIKYCPHTPKENCDCRKPKPKLINELCKEYEININNSAFIGDKISDEVAAKNAKIRYFFSCRNYKNDLDLWDKIYNKISKIIFI